MSLAIIPEGTEKYVAFIKSGWKRGWTQERIYRELRRSDMPTLRRSTMLNVIRPTLAFMDSCVGLRRIARAGLIGEHWYQRALKGDREEYRTIVEIKGLNKDTGEYMERWVTVTHKELHQRGELEQDALAALEDADSPMDWEKMYPVETYKLVKKR